MAAPGGKDPKGGDDANNEFTDEERAKLNSIINIFAGKDDN